MLRYVQLFPGRIANQHVKAGSLSEEHLREQIRHVRGLEWIDGITHLTHCCESDELLGVPCLVNRHAEALGDGYIEDRVRRGRCVARLRQHFCTGSDFRLVGPEAFA